MDTQSRIRVFDLHCDTLDRLALHETLPEAGFAAEDAGIPAHRMSSLLDNDAHISLNRMAPYDWCQCFAAFIPDGLGVEKSWEVFQTVRRYFEAQLKEHAGRIEHVRDARDVRSCVSKGPCAALFTVEGGSFLAERVDRVFDIAKAGVKMMTLTWNGANAIASGNKTMMGLTSFGRSVISAMEDCRMVVDVSHLNDVSFADVARVAQRPFVASHSNARAVCSHPRNLTDDQFRVIVERGGLVGLNFYNAFLAESGEATPDSVCFHVEHFLELGGEHVLSLGSDYDGSDVPAWLAPADKIRTLYELLAREFGVDIAEAVFFENACAFFERNEVLPKR